MGCSVLDNDKDAKIVHIIPIITRSNDIEIAELGAGGGKGDLDHKEELETGDVTAMGRLMELCAQSINNPDLLSKVLKLLQQALNSGSGSMDFGLQLQKEGQVSEDNLSLQKLVTALSSSASKTYHDKTGPHRNKTIRFPYSRHSSYSELCELVSAFKPRDVFPCTVDEITWTPELSMKALFGEFCSAQSFRHDAEMMHIFRAKREYEKVQKRDRSESQQDTQLETTPEITGPSAAKSKTASLTVDKVEEPAALPEARVQRTTAVCAGTTVGEASKAYLAQAPCSTPTVSIARATMDSNPREVAATTTSTFCPFLPSSKANTSKSKRKRRMTNAHLAYEAAIGMNLTWWEFGGLESVRGKEEKTEQEL
jgi:hypothetical protein